MIDIEQNEIDLMINIYDFVLKLVCTKTKDEIVDYIMAKIENLEKQKETQS